MEPRLILSKEHFEFVKTLLTEMKSRGIKSIDWYFSGSGDEGTADDGVPTMSVETESPTSETRQWVHDLNDDNIIDEIINTTGVDWWNNDGGAGNLTIDAFTRTVTLEIGTYTQELSNEPTHVARF